MCLYRGIRVYTYVDIYVSLLYKFEILAMISTSRSVFHKIETLTQQCILWFSSNIHSLHNLTILALTLTIYIHIPIYV